MDLPVRILTEPGEELVISVDGTFGAPGLNLSHWPGNTTPVHLKHDLSTGIALNFARLEESERERLAAGAVALVNNHYDTDGLLAMLAVLNPQVALPRAAAMLDAAAAGDLFRCPSDQAFVVDCIVTAMADPGRSLIADELSGLDDVARWERATHEMLERLPAVLDGQTAPYEDLWAGQLERLIADRRQLLGATFDELTHLDFALWTAPPGGAEPFDPGRHALWARTSSDRLLVLGPGDRGTRARFLIGTRSFFDLCSAPAQPRPDLAELAARLNQLEGSAPDGPVAWRHQDGGGASPELWFGTAGLAPYAEHAGHHLRPSTLAPWQIKAQVVEALRASWVFPEDAPQIS